MRNLTFPFLILIGMVFSGCSREPVSRVLEPGRLKAFQKHIVQKDSLFRQAIWSPIKEEERTDFGGLVYFPYNPDFRFKGRILRQPDPDSVSISATGAGDIRSALRYGYFAFEYRNAPFRLAIFQMAPRQNPGQSFLFLGFTDRTTGQETYGAGRYLDLEENLQDSCVIDFNYAYNPYCAYNERYSCALPPQENALPFAVKAGEKIYAEH